MHVIVVVVVVLIAFVICIFCKDFHRNLPKARKIEEEKASQPSCKSSRVCSSLKGWIFKWLAAPSWMAPKEGYKDFLFIYSCVVFSSPLFHSDLP